MGAYMGIMASKNISITEDAYDALLKEKKKDESFTEIILRLTKSRGKLSDCLGTWVMSDEEEERIFKKDLPKHWSRSRERLKEIANEMS
jgi:predicted CopG family antitoxin